MSAIGPIAVGLFLVVLPVVALMFILCYPNSDRVKRTQWCGQYICGAIGFIPIFVIEFIIIIIGNSTLVPMVQNFSTPPSPVNSTQVQVILAFPTSFLVAAFPEETLKYVCLIIAFKILKGKWPNLWTAANYGMAGALGFATVENFRYVVLGNQTYAGILLIGLIRAFTAVPSHAATGFLMGIESGRYQLAGTPFLHWWGYFIAVCFHGVYDGMLFIFAACSIGTSVTVQAVFLAVGVGFSVLVNIVAWIVARDRFRFATKQIEAAEKAHGGPLPPVKPDEV